MNRNEINRIAQLARIELTEAEITEFGEQMTEIMEMFDTLAEVDTKDVEPLTHVFDKIQTPAEDAVEPSLSRDDILAGAADTEGPFFKVSTVMKKEQG